ncbi:MAG TPA: hypothetical protein GXZ23_00800 [Clostridiales bacterium]|nr:hypothetical protein [Clostridiales bacterium]
MIGIIKRLFAAFLALFVFFPSNVDTWYSLNKEANMSAIIIGDVHMEGNNMDRFKNIGKYFNNAFATEKQPDAVGFLGDNTMNGQYIEWMFFYGFLERFDILDKTVVAMGNHDFGNNDDADTYAKTSKRCIRNYNDYCNKNIDKVYYSTMINGYKFIVLGSESNEPDTISNISDEQIDWLKAELASADGKPVFVLNHNLVSGTTGYSGAYFNQTTNDAKLRAALHSYIGKVFYFCGHSHAPLSMSSIADQLNVAYINLPELGSGVGLTIDAFDNYVEIKFYDYFNAKPVEGFASFTFFTPDIQP